MRLAFVLVDAATPELRLVIDLEDQSTGAPKAVSETLSRTRPWGGGFAVGAGQGSYTVRQGGVADEGRRRVRRMKSQDRR